MLIRPQACLFGFVVDSLVGLLIGFAGLSGSSVCGVRQFVGLAGFVWCARSLGSSFLLGFVESSRSPVCAVRGFCWVRRYNWGFVGWLNS